MGLLDRLLGKQKPQPPEVPLHVRYGIPEDKLAPPEQRPRATVVDDRDESKLPDNAILLGGQGRVEVTGESHYQEALDRVCGGKCKEGHSRKVLALLQPDFDNAYDENAIGIYVAPRS